MTCTQSTYALALNLKNDFSDDAFIAFEKALGASVPLAFVDFESDEGDVVLIFENDVVEALIIA